MLTRVCLTAAMVAGLSAFTASEARAQWRAVPYDAANFTASGSMTWTVEETDQKTFSYMVNDRTMTVSVWIDQATVSGTGGQELFIKIPAGHKAGSNMFSPVFIRRDSGVPVMEVGLAVTNPGLDKIKIYRPDFSNHQLGLNQNYLYFTLTFDLQ